MIKGPFDPFDLFALNPHVSPPSAGREKRRKAGELKNKSEIITIFSKRR
jgi:hypothetical protein